MIAYKFLDVGGLGRFSMFAWPRAAAGASGGWVEAAPALCTSGIHACRVGDLPFWLDVELWRIELDGPVVEAHHKVIAGRGRLIERVVGWDETAARDFSSACAERATELAGDAVALGGYVADAHKNVGVGPVGVCGSISARVAELVGGVAGYDAERAAQVRWLADRLGLETDAR